MADWKAAPAKVNLFLHVTGRRPDGYHLLDSLIVFAEAGDRLIAHPARTLTLEVCGPNAASLREGAGENLVLRAARALAVRAGIEPGARLILEKNLPVASGIGGGSADAAASLRVLARLWGLQRDDAMLHDLACSLGADVPACLSSRTARMGGVGEVLTRAPSLPTLGLVLVNPGVTVSTPSVFGQRDGAFSEPATLPAGWSSAVAMADDISRLRNDLEAPALRLCPAISHALTAVREMPGCLLARMSGSGATCFGLFADPAQARAATSWWTCPPGWWAWGGAAIEAGAPAAY